MLVSDVSHSGAIIKSWLCNRQCVLNDLFRAPQIPTDEPPAIGLPFCRLASLPCHCLRLGPRNSMSSSAFRSVSSRRQLAQHVLVGMGAASFWRGAWYILDDNLFPDDKTASAVASLGLGTLGMAASQGLVERAERLAEKLAEKTSMRTTTAAAAVENTTMRHASSRLAARYLSAANTSTIPPRLLLAASRVGALYTVAISVVLVWRGTWIGWDVLYETLHPEQYRSNHAHSPGDIPSKPAIKSTDAGHLTQSGALSHFTAVFLLLTSGLFASVLAPPAAASIIRDVSVRAGQSYVGPAQKLADRLFSGSMRRSIMTNNTPRPTSSSMMDATRNKKQ